MIVSETKIRIRYNETDQMGYVHHGNYAAFYEIGRTELIREIGFSYRHSEESGVMMPVILMESKYMHPVKYDEEITIKTLLKAMPAARIVFHYELYNASAKLVHTGATTLVFVDAQTRRPQRPPLAFIEKLKPYFNE